MFVARGDPPCIQCKVDRRVQSFVDSMFVNRRVQSFVDSMFVYRGYSPCMVLIAAFKVASIQCSSVAAIRSPRSMFRRFNGAGGELHPYGSFYLTGYIYDKPLSALREDLSRLGLARAEGISEPEDNISFLLNTMHDLITDVHGQGMNVAGQKDFFDRHIGSWAVRFFEDLEGAENAVFYRPVGTIGQLLMGIENKAFTLAA